MKCKSEIGHHVIRWMTIDDDAVSSYNGIGMLGRRNEAINEKATKSPDAVGAFSKYRALDLVLPS